ITEKGRPVSSEHNIFVKGGGCRCWLIELIKKMVIHVRENRIQRLQDKLEKIGDSDPTDEAMNKKAVYEKRIRRITEHMVSATE
ncbi:MAG TPA: hypothetical protein VJC18_04690, partial [bacterium]|nr:hypothetical protein [bacterium]